MACQPLENLSCVRNIRQNNKGDEVFLEPDSSN